MKIFRKILTALLVFILLAGVFPADLISPASAASYTAYTDVSGHWAAGSINRLNRMGFISPDIFTGTRFNPNQFITRAEFFSLVVRSTGATAKAALTSFTDVANLPDTLKDVIACAVQMGIANGYPDGTMRPNDTILRQEAATLVARTLGMSTEADWLLSVFPDNAFIAPYARTYVAALIQKKVIQGYPDSSFRPNAYITRAEAARIIDTLFTTVYMPETGLRNVYLQGGVLIQYPGAELRDAVIDGDVTIGDGVGSGNVIIANCTINGSLIVRGGGPNSITITNSTISDGMYVASFSANTRISVTDNSMIPSLSAVSGFTLSGSGVPEITILENAGKNAVVNLTGVNLNDLLVNGPGAQVLLNSGHIINTRFGDSAQGASLVLAANTSVGQLTIGASNVAVSGAGAIRNLLVNHSGAVVAQNPELLTLGVNVIASVGGLSVTSPESQWSNLIDRVSNDSPLKVELLTNTSAAAPFDQATLYLSMVQGRVSSDVHVTQSAANRIPLTQRGNRQAYWVGFFVPAPPDAGSMASITYTHVDGDIVTLPPQSYDTYGGRTGLLVYLPVFREPGKETGMLKEIMYINWGGHLTENIQFFSTTLHLAPLTTVQKNALQKNFDNKIMYSIQTGAAPYSGAEAVRRILSSDNPLGLPTSDTKGLDAMNRALSSVEVRDILENQQFASEFNIDTTGNSLYSVLSDAGRQYVAEQVLAARKAGFSTPTAIKTVFDKAVQARLQAETTLLGQINSSIDYATLRKLIETASNAVILQFQTGAEPYKSYTSAQKDAMANYLWKLRQFRSIQEVIDAIRKYLGEPANMPGDEIIPDQVDIVSIVAKMNSTPSNFAVGSPPFVSTLEVTIRTGDGQTRLLTTAEVSKLTLQFSWRTSSSGNPIAAYTRNGDTISFTALRTGSDVLTVTHTVSGKSCTISINVRTPVSATAISFKKTDIMMRVGQTLNLWDLDQYLNLTPQNATDLEWIILNPEPASPVASINQYGVVTGIKRSPLPATVTVRTRSNGLTATCSIWVFDSDYDIFVQPEKITLQAGASTREGQLRVITATPVVSPLRLRWTADDPASATVDIMTGIITASLNPANPTATITVTLEDLNRPGIALATAVVKVSITAQIGFNVVVQQSILENKGRDSAPYFNLLRLEPLTSDYELPEVFIWNSSNPVIRFSVDGGKTSYQRLETQPGQMPQIVTDGIGMTTITLYTSDYGPPAAEPRYIISAPRGVSGMEFYLDNNTMPMDDPPDYGRVVEMVNGTTRRVRAIEPGQVTRNMAWIMYHTDSQRTAFLTSANTRLSYNTSSNILTATAMGLARVVVTPTVSNLPPGWGMTVADQRGRWYGQSNNDPDSDGYLPLFISDGGGGYVFNGSNLTTGQIDEGLSGLRILDTTTGQYLPSSAFATLNYLDVQSGAMVICDVNGVKLTSAGTDPFYWNPSNIRLVVTTADALGSNELFVWIQPRPPVITPMDRPNAQIPFSQYANYWLNIPVTPGYNSIISYEIIGDYEYDSAVLPNNDLSGPLKLAVWTLINSGSRAIAANTGLTSIIFGRNTSDMPEPATINIPYRINFQAEIKYTTNAGFANKMDPSDVPYRTETISFTASGNPAAYTFTVVADEKPVELNRVLYVSDDPIYTAANPGTDIDDAWDKLFFNAISMMCALQGIDISTAKVEISYKDLTLPGVALIRNTGAYAGANREIIGLSAGPVRVIITAAGDPAKAVSVLYNIEPKPGGWGGIYPLSTPIDIDFEDASTTVDELPVFFAAAMSLEIPPAPSLTALQLRSTASVGVGKSMTLVPYITPYNADISNLVWSSSNTAIATVNGGLVTGVKAGTATITATDEGGNIKATCKVTVKADTRPVTSITMSAKTLTVNVGATGSLSVTYKPSNTTVKGVSWASSDETIARVDPNGKVTGVMGGTAVITAISDSGACLATCVVTVKIPVTSVTLSEQKITLKIGETYQLVPVIDPYNATVKDATYSSNYSSRASVSASGLITAKSAGTVTITVKVDGKSVKCTVVVTK